MKATLFQGKSMEDCQAHNLDVEGSSPSSEKAVSRSFERIQTSRGSLPLKGDLY